MSDTPDNRGGGGEQQAHLYVWYQPGELQSTVTGLRRDLGDNNEELIKQVLSDLHAQHRQQLRTHFEARMEYIKQIGDERRVGLDGIREYGMQTLKWTFLLNAGAAAIVIAYAERSGVPHSESAAILKALWPFAVGCVLVVFAGAAGFFNFSYAEASMPSPQLLHNFLSLDARAWPLARFQRPDETPEQFTRRFAWKIGATRTIAISLAFGSGFFFLYGVYRVWRIAMAGV